MGATMLTRGVELRSPVPPDHQATPYPTHLPAPHDESDEDIQNEDKDEQIRNTDMPERMQLRDVLITSVEEGSDELDLEAQWINKNAFSKSSVSNQVKTTT
jgi:transcription elongation factor SPT6